MKTIITKDSLQIAKIIQSGGVVAYPTEAVFGLGCDPSNKQAVLRLLDIKQRSESKGLILIADSLDQLSSYISPLSESLKSKVLSAWPGPVTWLLPKSVTSPEWISGQYKTIATRVSKHPPCQSLCKACSYPLVSTSANPAGLSPAKTVKEVSEYFNGKIDAIYNDEIGKSSKPTRIIDGLTEKVIREG